MVAEIGQFALVIALCLAIAQSTIPLIGAHRNNLSWMSVGRTAASGQFLFLLISFVCLLRIGIPISLGFTTHGPSSWPGATNTEARVYK